MMTDERSLKQHESHKSQNPHHGEAHDMMTDERSLKLARTPDEHAVAGSQAHDMMTDERSLKLLLLAVELRADPHGARHDDRREVIETRAEVGTNHLSELGAHDMMTDERSLKLALRRHNFGIDSLRRTT